MPAYIVVDIQIHDPASFDRYRELVPATIEAFGGKYIARGGAVEVLEGEWKPQRITIVEFESVEQAKKWLDSTEYAYAKGIRHRAAHTNMIVVDGVKS